MEHVETTDALMIKASRRLFTVEGKPADAAMRPSTTKIYRSC